MEDVFVKWEGDISKVVEVPSVFEASKFVNNSWELVSSKLVATLLFEGMPLGKDEILSLEKSKRGLRV